jgi:AcrR family transcriptional regulator
LLKVAQRLFLKRGYDGTSMSMLAEQANVAANTIYWYFEDKDALLVEVLNATMVGMTGEYLKRVDDSLESQLLWLCQVFDETSQLVSTVHTRAGLSPAVAQWHERFHSFLEAAFVEQMRRRNIPHARAKHAARITTFVLEGLISHGLPERERKELIQALISHLD